MDATQTPATFPADLVETLVLALARATGSSEEVVCLRFGITPSWDLNR